MYRSQDQTRFLHGRLEENFLVYSPLIPELVHSGPYNPDLTSFRNDVTDFCAQKVGIREVKVIFPEDFFGLCVESTECRRQTATPFVIRFDFVKKLTQQYFAGTAYWGSFVGMLAAKL